MSSKSYSLTQTTAKDLRTEFGGATAQQIAAPGAVTTQPGSVGVAAGDYSNISMNLTGAKFRAGMSGAEVKDLLGQQASIAQETVSKVADFATSTLAQQATAQTGELPNWQKYIPYIIGAIVIIAILKARA
jgi:hypothetical protein